MPFAMASVRQEVLRTAEGMVCGHREEDYGAPEDSFGRIAALWSAYLGRQVSGVDVAALMVLMKVARTQASPAHRDSWVDIAGYAACGAEAAVRS